MGKESVQGSFSIFLENLLPIIFHFHIIKIAKLKYFIINTSRNNISALISQFFRIIIIGVYAFLH